MKPDIRIPEEFDDYKFIQVYIDGVPCLIVESEQLFHGQILEKILVEHEITDFEKFNISRYLTAPVAKGNRYELTGAGICVREENVLLFSGKSVDYEVRPDKEHLDKCRPYIKDKIIIS